MTEEYCCAKAFQVCFHMEGRSMLKKLIGMLSLVLLAGVLSGVSYANFIPVGCDDSRKQWHTGVEFGDIDGVNRARHTKWHTLAG